MSKKSEIQDCFSRVGEVRTTGSLKKKQQNGQVWNCTQDPNSSVSPWSFESEEPENCGL